MNTHPISLQKLSEILYAFDKERKWEDMTAGDLSKSIVLEAAELLEHFQWDETASKRGQITTKDKEEIQDEIADILTYLIKFCRVMEIDMEEAVLKKLEKVRLKYPVEKLS